MGAVFFRFFCVELCSSSKRMLPTSVLVPTLAVTHMSSDSSRNGAVRSEEPRGGSGGHYDGQQQSYQSPGPESDSAASSAPRAHPRDTVPAGAAKLFVGQVPWACSESDLYSLFAPFGKLHEVVIFRNRVSQDRGTCVFHLVTDCLAYLL